MGALPGEGDCDSGDAAALAPVGEKGGGEEEEEEKGGPRQAQEAWPAWPGR